MNALRLFPAVFGSSLCAALAACGAMPAHEAQNRAAVPPREACPITDQDDALCAANAGMRTAYAATRKRMLVAADPLIIDLNGHVILVRDGRRESFESIGDLYHELKSVAHVTLGLFVMLHPLVG